MSQNGKSLSKIQRMAYIAMFGAVSAVLMFMEISVPLAPSFVKFDFSELPVILGGYMMGPAAGAVIAVLKVALNLVMKGTYSAGIGELSNLIGSLCYMLPSVLIYRTMKTKKGAEISLALGTVIVSLCLLCTNTFFIFPAYAKMFGMGIDQLVEIGAMTNPLVNSYFSLMVLSVLPFNLFKYGVISVITVFTYKRVKSVLHL